MNNEKKEKEIQEYFDTLLKTNRKLEDYVEWKKINENIKKLEINLYQLNYLTKPKNEKDFWDKVEILFNENKDVYHKTLEILIAKRDNKSFNDKCFFDPETLTVNYYNLNSLEEIKYFIKKTNLYNLFSNVVNLKDYVFGVEVGLDTNARKGRTGKIHEEAIKKILEKNNIDFTEQKRKLIIEEKVVDFIFSRNNKEYFIESSFYNVSGSKINETLKSYITLTRNLDENTKLIWLADGNGMMSIKKKLIANWNDITIMNIKQFENWLSSNK